MKLRMSIKDSFQIDHQYNLVRLSTKKIAPILALILAPMYTRVYISTYTRAYTWAYNRDCTRACTCGCARARTCEYACIHTRVYTCAYTRASQRAEAGCYYKKKVRWKTLQIQKI